MTNRVDDKWIPQYRKPMREASGGVLESVPVVGTVLLNWNGWQDTLACLDSLFAQEDCAQRVIVADNGSTDGSVERVLEWAESQEPRITVHRLKRDILSGGVTGESATSSCLSADTLSLFLIENGENLGFAAGNNVAIRFALDMGCDYVFLLNNDTTIAPTAVKVLVQFMEGNPDYAASSALTYIMGQDRIWNAGADINFMGLRKYRLANAPRSAAPKGGYSRVQFVTGCAICIRSTFLQEYGLLTEQFFFGEEDYELSRRVADKGMKLACVYDAIVEHKVSASTGRISRNRIAKAYLFYICRYIAMRGYMHPVSWQIWRVAYLFYIIPMLRIRRRIPMRDIMLFVRVLWRDSAGLDDVNRTYFETVMQGGLEALA